MHDVRVAILDDHDVARRGLDLMVQSFKGMQVAGVHDTSLALLTALSLKPIDVLLMDYALSPNDLDGVALVAELRRRHPDLHILVVSGQQNALIVRNCLKAGAHGYFFKTQGAQELQAAVRTVLAGETYLPPGIAA